MNTKNEFMLNKKQYVVKSVFAEKSKATLQESLLKLAENKALKKMLENAKEISKST